MTISTCYVAYEYDLVRSKDIRRELWIAQYGKNCPQWIPWYPNLEYQPSHEWQDTARFARTESHTKVGVICPSLVLLASGAP